MPTLTLFRGLPGSGKSTEAKKLGCIHLEADMYFQMDSEYVWIPERIGHAHRWCKDMVESNMKYAIDITVSNTFTKQWEVQPYIDLANKHGYTITIFRCVEEYGNTHSVPEKTIQEMKARFEDIESEIILDDI
jgi:predicted kinase